MVKNDRINDCKWLILVLKDAWIYEKYWENTLIIVQLVFLFLRGLGESKWKSKNAKDFGILHNKKSSLGSYIKPINTYSMISIEITITILIQSI